MSANTVEFGNFQALWWYRFYLKTADTTNDTTIFRGCGQATVDPRELPRKLNH